MNENSISVIEQKINPLIDRAHSLVISTQEDMETATTLLSQMNVVMDAVTKEKERVTRPLLDALEAERSRWRPIETAYKSEIVPLRERISTYQTAQTRLQEAEAARLASEIVAGNVSLDDATTALSTLQKPSERIITPSGGMTFREKTVLKIIDEKVIPRAYLVPDEAAIMIVLSAGKKVKGCGLEIIQVPINRR